MLRLQTSFKIMSGSRWKLLMRGMPYLRSKEKKLVPWVPRGLYQEKKNAWDDGTFSYHRKLCLITKFSFTHSNVYYNYSKWRRSFFVVWGNLSVKWFLLPLKYFSDQLKSKASLMMHMDIFLPKTCAVRASELQSH